MPITELGLYESDEDVEAYRTAALDYYSVMGVHLREHRPEDAHQAGIEALSYITAWQTASEEKSYLLRYPLVLPKAGEYYCISSSVALITEVKLPQPTLKDTYRKRQDSYISAGYVQVDGKRFKAYRSWCFESYSKMCERGIVSPVVDVLTDEQPPSIRDAVAKLLPFVPIREGEYLSKSLLRKLAKQVTRTIAKERC